MSRRMASSRNFEDPDYDEFERTGALPARTEERASTNLRSPEFQQAAPEPEPELPEPTAPPVATTPVLPPSAVAPPKPLAPPPAPTLHRRFVDDRMEAAVQQRDAATDARNQAGYDRYLRDNGIEFDTQPDGRQTVATHEDGRPKYREEVSDPVQNQAGRWVKQHRNNRGETREIDLIGTGQYKLDRQTGTRYITGKTGEVIQLGVDDSFLEAQKIKAERERLSAANTADKLARQQIRADLEAPKKRLAELRESAVDVGGFSEPVKDIENRLLNKENEDPEYLKESKTALDAWYAKNPEYKQLSERLLNDEAELTNREQRERNRAARIAFLSNSSTSAEVAALLPPTLRQAATQGEGDVGADDLELEAAEIAENEGVSLVEATRRALERRKSEGSATVAGKPIEEVRNELIEATKEERRISTVRNIAESMGRGAIAGGIFSGIEGLGLLLANVSGKLFGTESGIADNLQRYADATADFRQDVREAMPGAGDFPKSLPSQIFEGIGQAAATLPLYIIPGVGKAIGAAHTVGQIYAEGFNDALQSGTDLETAHSAAVKYMPAAVLDVAADKLIIGKVLKPLKGKMSVGQLLKQIGTMAGFEGATEGAQQLWLNTVAKFLQGYDPERRLDDEVIQSVIVGTAVGGTVTAAGSLATNAFAAEAAQGGDGSTPATEGASPTPPPIPPSARYASKLADLEDVRGKIATATDVNEIATAEKLKDRGKNLQREIHGLAEESKRAIPDAQRTALGKLIDPALDVAANESAFGSDVTTSFASAEIGRQVRSAYLKPERETVISQFAQTNNLPESVAQTVVDQHLGMMAVRDLQNVLTGGAIEASKAELLTSLNLLQPVTDEAGTVKLAVTDDALPLLPKGVREQVKRNREAMNLVETPGPPSDGLAALVRAGQRRFADAFAAIPPIDIKSNGDKTYNVTAQFKTRDGEVKTASMSIDANSHPEAVAKGAARVKDAAAEVVDVQAELEDDLDMTPVGPTEPTQAAPFTFDVIDTEGIGKISEPSKEALKVVRREFGRNTKLMQALGVNRITVARFHNDSTSGMVVRNGELLVDPSQIADHFIALASQAGEVTWTRNALIEETIHLAQFKAEGRNFNATYEAVFASAPADLIEATREAYTDFDTLPDYAKGAEMVRMVIQQRWKGSITEQVFKAVENVLNYLKGLNIESTPVLAEAIARTEAVLREAQAETESRVTNPTSGVFSTDGTDSTATTAEGATGDAGDVGAVPDGELGVTVDEPATPVGEGETPGTDAVLGERGGRAKNGSRKAGDGKAGDSNSRLDELAVLPMAELADAISNKKVSDVMLVSLYERFRGKKREVVEAEMLRRSREETLADANETIQGGGDDVLDWIIKRGGIQISPTNEVGEVKRLRENPKARRPGLFTKAGASLDELRNDAVSRGYRMPDGRQIETVSDMLDMLEARLNGPKNFPVIASLEDDARIQGFLGASKARDTSSDMFAGSPDDPFNLVSETTAERQAREAREDSERRTAEAEQSARDRAESDGRQEALFASRFDPNQSAFNFGVNTQPDELQLDRPAIVPSGRRTNEPSGPALSANELVQENMGLAVTIANRYRNIPGADFDDILAESRRALVKAARAFDPEMGAKFSSYAGNAIENQLRTLYGQEKRYTDRQSVTLDEPVSEDGASTRADLIEGSSGSSVSAGIEQAETSAILQSALGTLAEKPRRIIEMRLEGRTFEEIGAELGVSKQAASKVEQVARQRIQEALRERGISGVDPDGVLFAAKAPKEPTKPPTDTTGWTAEKSADVADGKWIIRDKLGNIQASVLPTFTTAEAAIKEAARAIDARPPAPATFGPVIKWTPLRLFLGAADVLERTKGLEPLAAAIRKHVDRARKLGADMANPFRKWEKKHARKDRAKALKEFEAFQAANDTKRKDDASQVYSLASAPGKELINLWRATAAKADAMNKAQKLEVYDEKTKSYRSIGSVKDYYPRSIKPEILELIQNKTRNVKLWEEIVGALIEGGQINDREEAHEFLAKSFQTEKSFDYLGHIEAARQLKLPNKMYDYSFAAGRRYLLSWSERMAQIEAYGQVTKENPKDLFDQIADGTLNKGTAEYIKAVQARAYGTTPNNMWARIASALNLVATATMLGNPVTVGINLMSGLAYNAATIGITPALKGAWEMRKGFASIEDSYEKGILQDDLMSMMQDVEQLSSPFMKRLAEGTGQVLKWTGYNASEEFVRGHGLLTAKAFLRSAIKEHKKNPTSKASERYRDFFRRNGVDPAALLAEDGAGDVTDTYLRSAINAAQGGYRFDQVPVFVDTALGRFIFKYQKWGTQAARNFELNVVQPLKKGNVVPLISYLAVVGAVGASIDELKELLFGMPKRDADWDEIGKTMSEDTKRGLAMAGGKVLNHMLSAGAVGIVGNYFQSLRDVAERSRFKNPMDPPGLAIIKNSWELTMRLKEQGTLTIRDFDDFARSQIGLYRTVESAGAKALNAAGADFKWQLIEKRRQDLQWLGVQTRRFASEIGVEASRTSLGRVAKTPDSPFQRKLSESLMIGDTQTAREVLREHLAKYKDPRDRKAELRSIQASIRAKQPVRVGAAGEARRALFLDWAKKKMSREDLERVKALDTTYRQSARLVGLMSVDKPISRSKLDEALNRMTYRSRAEEA